MADLRGALTAGGFADVRTHLQSGNVLLRSELSGDALVVELERQIHRAFALDVGVVVRTREELAAVVALDPLRTVASDRRLYQVSFLAEAPTEAIIERVSAAAHPPEAVYVCGREVYAWHPEGSARSRLALTLSDRKLGVVATARNWNTVASLLELAGED